MADYKSIEWLEDEKALRLLNQLMLPGKLEYCLYTTVEGIASAIKDMTVRGAPAIGVAAAYGLVAAANETGGNDLDQLKAKLANAAALLRNARPTAVNLFWALDEMEHRANIQGATSADDLMSALLHSAHDIAQEDITINTNIGKSAPDRLPQPRSRTFCHMFCCMSESVSTASVVIARYQSHARAQCCCIDVSSLSISPYVRKRYIIKVCQVS